jgi:hypothetical protein
MSALSYKPLRKPRHLTQITDEEITWKIQDRQRATKYFSEIPTHKFEKVYKKRLSHKTRILPDARGKIQDILLTLPPYYDQKNPDVPVDPNDARHFQGLLKQLSKHKRHYTILCHASQVKTVRRWFKTARITEYHIAISVFNYSIWAQDAYLALTDDKKNTWLSESICFIRDHDMSVADDVSMQTELKRMQSYLYFQGGNVLQIGDFVVIGMDYILENQGRVFLETQVKVLKAFEVLLGYPVIALGRKQLIPHKDRQYLGGGLFQPVFHIDMYVTPTNKRGKKNREIVFVGSPRLAREILKEKTQEHDLDIYFDEAAEQLGHFFDVQRLPLLPCQYMSKEMTMARHYYLSYNNAIVESYEEKGKKYDHVYLPAFEKSVRSFCNEPYVTQYYGTEKRYRKLDTAARNIWESLGYTVFGMEGLEDLAMSWGSVHCIVKAVKRSCS